jgi:hypothetical protein
MSVSLIQVMDQKRVWTFDQMMAKIGSGPGFCAGIVISWILLRAYGRDFATKTGKFGPEAIISEEQKELIRNYMNKYLEIAMQSDGSLAYESVMREVGGVGSSYIDVASLLSVEGKRDEAGKEIGYGYAERQLRDIPRHVAEATTMSQCFFLIRFRPTGRMVTRLNHTYMDDRGHVVCIEVNGVYGQTQTFRLMDPNDGCYLCHTMPEFQIVCEGLVVSKGYASLYSGSFTVEQIIRPKPVALATEVLSYFSSTFFS